MRVLYVGSGRGQSLLMQKAMQRRGHRVFAVDPYAVLRGNDLLTAWAWRTGALGLSVFVEALIRRAVGPRVFDVAFVDNGELVPAAAVGFLKSRAGRVALFNRDNPFVARDGQRWRVLLGALPHYDLFVTRRQTTADIAAERGIQRVLRLNLFADEVLHQPGTPSAAEMARYGSPVSFVGTWFPERGVFMETLLRRGVPLRIIGNRWERAANYSAIRHAVVPGYLDAEQYSAAVRSSQIAIGLLSKGNQDLQTARSLEIPAMGVLFCGERTSEHEALYADGEEAVFWSDAEDCAAACLDLLARPERIAAIAAAGRRRILSSENWTEMAMERMLQTAVASP